VNTGDFPSPAGKFQAKLDLERRTRERTIEQLTGVLERLLAAPAPDELDPLAAQLPQQPLPPQSAVPQRAPPPTPSAHFDAGVTTATGVAILASRPTGSGTVQVPGPPPAAASPPPVTATPPPSRGGGRPLSGRFMGHLTSAVTNAQTAPPPTL